ncbi:MAG: hypothetical protein IH892_01650 [Planctomycetes bacterium]|nr:hypothetical protein [Planctomycetota bacterium]
MSNINFVPDDYVENNESRRTNVLCMGLLVVVMAALGGAFVTIKIRQKACLSQEELVNAKMTKMQEAIAQFEELQAKRKEMMRTALTTAELLEPVPRSVLLATLTNNLPPGASLVRLRLVQKDTGTKPQTKTSNYEAAQNKQNASQDVSDSPEKRLETFIDIEGIAPTDLQVASYIERLGNCALLHKVTLVESKEFKVHDSLYRRFDLKAQLVKEVHLTQEDVDQIRRRAEKSILNF